MKKKDKLISYFAYLKYAMGSAKAKALVASMGIGTKVHMSVKYWCPSKVLIGNDCEIRHNTFLDARSEKDVSIKIGDGTRIKDNVALAAYGGMIHIGRNVLIGRSCTLFGHGGIYLGDYSMLGPNVIVTSSNHIATLEETPFQLQGFTREKIHIDTNVWIGANSCVLAGANIAANTVVAAGSVVQGELIGGWLYGGIPVKPIKKLELQKPVNVQIFTKDWGLFY